MLTEKILKPGEAANFMKQVVITITQDASAYCKVSIKHIPTNISHSLKGLGQYRTKDRCLGQLLEKINDAN